ncbi:predicted protein [Micromonas commoda]|uniref:Uncharacterized protein n=1 Tax=Micromonas commoda (strain RCC299 / NOUM17 / CCMP2709) TaxID=296587 RepID=C1EC05_MICCC|nr:predicted protein [Micromonas commoda]ACO65507.1 predicted protein [Micromonas commoda]|eukprot:XP_002504249.1 predicted protein [Micromonas commoda]
MAATCTAVSAARVTAPTVTRSRNGAGTNNLRAAVARPASRRASHARVAPRAVATETATSAPATAAGDTALIDSLRPTSAECAKTLVAIANTGTISTACEDGIPLGTFASYVVSKEGEVILRMRADALHTANVTRDPRCSLYVQPATQPPGVLSRATLIGSLSRLDDEAATKASKQYNETHGENVGVDAVAGSDVYYKFDVDRVFYVGGLGSDKRAEVVSAADFDAALSDPLARIANSVVDAMNGERYEDVMNFARASLPDEAEPAEARMLWVDQLGFDVRVITSAGDGAVGKVLDVRVPFPAPATTQQQVLSSLTMLAQVMWEEEKQYQPQPVPQETTSGEGSD